MKLLGRQVTDFAESTAIEVLKKCFPEPVLQSLRTPRTSRGVSILAKQEGGLACGNFSQLLCRQEGKHSGDDWKNRVGGETEFVRKAVDGLRDFWKWKLSMESVRTFGNMESAISLIIYAGESGAVRAVWIEVNECLVWEGVRKRCGSAVSRG